MVEAITRTFQDPALVACIVAILLWYGAKIAFFLIQKAREKKQERKQVCENILTKISKFPYPHKNTARRMWEEWNNTKKR